MANLGAWRLSSPLLDLPLCRSSPSPRNCTSNSIIVPAPTKTDLSWPTFLSWRPERLSKKFKLVSLWLVTLTKISMPTSATSPRNSKNANTYVLLDLMKEFMTSQHLPFVPQLIQEVADFKAFIKDYHYDRASVLKGIIDMHFFDSMWMTKVGPLCNTKNPPPMLSGCLRSIPLGCGKRMPTGISNCRLVNPSLYTKSHMGLHSFCFDRTSDNSEKDTAKVEAAKERKSHILKGLQKHINFWRISMSWNETYARDMHSYVQYWEDILEELHQPTPRAPPSFLEGFWPNTDWTTSAPPLNDDRRKFHPIDIDVTPEDVVPEPYCGPKKRNNPVHTYNPWRHVSCWRCLFLSVLMILSSFRFGWEEY